MYPQKFSGFGLLFVLACNSSLASDTPPFTTASPLALTSSTQPDPYATAHTYKLAGLVGKQKGGWLQYGHSYYISEIQEFVAFDYVRNHLIAKKNPLVDSHKYVSCFFDADVEHVVEKLEFAAAQEHTQQQEKEMPYENELHKLLRTTHKISCNRVIGIKNQYLILHCSSFIPDDKTYGKGIIGVYNEETKRFYPVHVCKIQQVPFPKDGESYAQAKGKRSVQDNRFLFDPKSCTIFSYCIDDRISYGPLPMVQVIQLHLPE
jgi:hypothetical protein